jgi:hypothetical protein
MSKALYLSLAMGSILLASCGSDSKKDASTLPNDGPERISADFLRNVISNESLNRGFLDRALYTYDELGESCPDSVVYYASAVIDGPMIDGVEVNPEAPVCKINYDRGDAFIVRSGSIAKTSYFGIHTVDNVVYYQDGYELDFYDLVLDLNGKKFTLNGRVHQPHAYEAQYITSDNFNIRDSQGTLYSFSNLKRALPEDELAKTLFYSMTGELKVSNITQPYQVKFSMPTAWQITSPNILPTAGELRIQDVNEPRTYSILKATNKPEQTLYFAYLPNKVVAQNLTVYWRNILIDPDEYRIPE